MEAKHIKKLRRMALCFGVKTVKLTRDKFRALHTTHHADYQYGRESVFHVAPFDPSMLGIDWENKVIEYVEGAHITGIIHELAHLVATKKAPNESDEWEFFGWEIAAIKGIAPEDWKDIFRDGNSNYVVDDVGFRELRTLNDEEFEALVEERIAYAQKIGIVDSHGVPLFVR